MNKDEAKRPVDLPISTWYSPINKIGRREPPESLTQQVIINPWPCSADLQKETEDYAKRCLKDELALKLYEIMEKGPLAVFVQPVIKSKIFQDTMQKAIRQTVYFRELTLCETCENFIPDGFNGGFCIKMQEYVHINDGCTLGPKMRKEGGGNE